MIPSSLRRLALTVILFALPALKAEAQPSGVNVSPGLIAEAVDTIGMEELWHLSAPKHVVSRHGAGPGGVIGVWRYDSESGPRSGEWVAICLILNGFGDVSETPSAIRVWGKAHVEPIIVERTSGPDRAASFAIIVGADSIILSHAPSGDVFVNDQQIGRIQ